MDYIALFRGLAELRKKKVKAWSGARFGGKFALECRDKYGNLKWTEDVSNVVTLEALDHILNVVLHGVTPISAWYCLLVESNTTPVTSMTYAVPTFTECTAYDEATRPAWVEGAASSQSITNSSNKSVFTISGTKTLYGAALVGGGTAATTKNDTAGGGILFCYAKFGTARSVEDNDVINLTYTVSAADDAV